MSRLSSSFLFIILFISSFAFAGSPVIWGPGFSNDLQPEICLNGNACVLSGSLIPTITAVSAPQGSIYMSTTGVDYIKNDNGLSTNWSNLTVGGTGSGTVINVALSLPSSVFSISGSPVTVAGTLTGNFINQTANTVFAGPTTGPSAAPVFRGLVSADIPNLSASKITSGQGTLSTSTTGVTVGSGANALLSNATVDIQTASGSQPGLLDSTDWNTFNNKQPAGNYITALTGDATASGPGSAALTLATVNTNTGSFGSSTAIPNFTVNGKGLITAAGTSVVIAPAGTLTGTTLASNVASSSLTSVGTISSGTWNGSTIAIANGGTGQTTASAAFNALSPITSIGDLIIGTGVNTDSRLAIGSNGTVLTSNGTTASWQSPATNGTVTSVSVVTANGLAGTVANSSTTPAITLSTTLNTPVIAGNGTALVAATTTGTGSTVVLNNGPTLIAPLLGTPASGVLTNETGLPLTTGVTGVLPVANGGTNISTVGSANQLFGVNSAATGYEFKSATMTAAGSLTIPSGQVVSHPQGSVTNPSVTITGDTGTGLYQSAADYLDIALEGNLGVEYVYNSGTFREGHNTSAPSAVSNVVYEYLNASNAPLSYLIENSTNSTNSAMFYTVQDGSIATSMVTYGGNYTTTPYLAGWGQVSNNPSGYGLVLSAYYTSGQILFTTGGTPGTTTQRAHISNTVLSLDNGENLNFVGSSSGTVTVGAQSAAGTYSLQLPNAQGPSNGVFSNNGSGVLSWVQYATGNTANDLVLRDGSGNFSAGTITASLSGNASTATNATNFTGSLSGDVTGTQSATVVSLVGGVTAANVASGANAANAASSNDTTGNTIVKRSSGAFTTGAVTATNLTLTASSTADLVVNSTSMIVDSVNNAVGIGVQPMDASTLTALNASGSTKPIWLFDYGVGSSSGVRGDFARGTVLSPSAAQSGDVLNFISGRGYGTSQFATASTGAISVVAGETFTNTSNATYIAFRTTSTGSVISSEQMRIAPTGDVLIGTTTDNGSNDLQINGSEQIGGTAGQGFINYVSQSSATSTPSSGFNLFSDSSNRLAWIGINGYVRTFDGTANTANRVYVLPNLSGNIALSTAIAPEGMETITSSSTYTILSTDTQIFVNSSSNAITLQLPNPNLYRTIRIKDVGGNLSTNNLNLLRFGSENIEGLAATKVFQTNYGSWTMQSDGTNWWVE